MLRISQVESPDQAVILRLEGRVIGAWVGELGRLCEGVLATGARLILDLSEVWFVDLAGVELVRSLANRHVAVLNCSRFVAEQLKA